MDPSNVYSYQPFNGVDRSSLLVLPTRPLSVEQAALAGTTTNDKATGQCMCCDCKLQYPEVVSRFRCPACGTVNDLKPPLEKVCLQAPLTLRYLKQMINDCKRVEGLDTTNAPKDSFYQPIEQVVDAVFGNWMCLNDSFLTGKPTTTEESGVALDDIRRMYRLLLNLPINVIRAMMRATDRLLKRPTVPLRRMGDIRFLLIILENPLLAQHNFPAETKYHYNILQHVFGLLSCLNNECHSALVQWFARYPSAVFVNKVDLVQKFMAHRINRAMKSKRDLPKAYESDWKVASAARVMALLFAANQKSNALVQHELDLKKLLRIEFVGEEGVDAGGLRKEWFLLLVRSLFDPQYGMFTYDDESTLCWFNPGSFENDDQFFLVGLVLGLAIYNSTILDIHLPSACYKKLLDQKVDLDDLAVFQPSLARGLKQLLSFDGDVEETYCRSFVMELDNFGERQMIPLLPDGEHIRVNNDNRRLYVDLYVDYMLNKTVERQFGAFQRGFYHMCGGNALSLFRPDEIELLVRGSDEALDIDLLRSRTEYHGFAADDPVILYFWNVIEMMEPKMQRKLLMFVTGSDRIPVTGSSHLYLQITCGGEDVGRLPSAHTCFNQLILYQHKSQDHMQKVLEMAILESQGFYVK
ncbi:hypothetical protein [Absidia glauca]|uniref:HECT-type E3 ubiquitin transferase n=1 Tax=Absidia glauca TaxID=4829 RepID=A0A168T5H3_ABSGL|nr:hypothetical protein [Absidia glauca]